MYETVGNDIIQTICTMEKKRARDEDKRARDEDERSRDSPKRLKAYSGWVTNIYPVFLWLYNAFVPASKTSKTSKTTIPYANDQTVRQVKELYTSGLLRNICFTTTRFDLVRDKELGKGGFGVVYGHKQDLTKAVKQFKSQTGQPVLATLKEAILVSLALACKVTVNLEECWITMPRFSGKELFDVVVERKDNPFDESELHTLGTQILEQLVELHQLGIVHRDIKLENIMYNTDGTIRLIDFGLAYCQPFDNTVLQSDWSKRCGSWMYMPPEMIKSSQSSQATDIWCTAIMMIVAATANNVPNIQSQDDVSTVLSKLSHNLSPGMVDVLRQMLEQDPQKRPSAKQALKLWTGVTP